jgi:hypothetical protein
MDEQLNALNMACGRCEIHKMENCGVVCAMCPIHQQREKVIQVIMEARLGVNR